MLDARLDTKHFEAVLCKCTHAAPAIACCAITLTLASHHSRTTPQVRDLLKPAEQMVDMELQKTSMGFSLPGLTKVAVTSAAQITEVMERGYENRCTAAHDINAHSSRSHALLIVEVASTNLASGIRTVGKLTLCDLAGRRAPPPCAHCAACAVRMYRQLV